MNPAIVPNINELIKYKLAFINELKKAENGTQTSLAYLPSELPQNSLVTDNETFQTMVVGGSVFQTALARFQSNQLVLLSKRQFAIGHIQDKHQFLEVIESNLDKAVHRVALNFTYPMKTVIRDGRLDGLLLKGSKESTFEGLVGELVGKSVETYLSAKSMSVQVAVANDIVCLALSGLSHYSKLPMLMTGVVGTGMNFGFLHYKTIVNIESGNFDKLTRSTSGQYLDSLHPETQGQFYEKEVSGAYLYQHYNRLAKQNGWRADLNSTEELNSLCGQNSVEGSLAKQLLERSAALIAVQIAGIYEFLSYAAKQRELLCIMEGSLFWEGWHYFTNVKHHLALLGINEGQIKFEKIADSALIGGSYLLRTVYE